MDRDRKNELLGELSDFPEAIPLVLTEDQCVQLQDAAESAGHESLALVVRQAQVDAFTRWHG